MAVSEGTAAGSAVGASVLAVMRLVGGGTGTRLGVAGGVALIPGVAGGKITAGAVGGCAQPASHKLRTKK